MKPRYTTNLSLTYADQVRLEKYRGLKYKIVDIFRAGLDAIDGAAAKPQPKNSQKKP